VAELPVPISEIPVTEVTHYDDTWGAEQIVQLRKQLTERTQNKIAIHIENIRSTVLYELKEFCKEKKPFAIVMASHHPSAFDQLFFVSVTLYAARHLEYPVLVVPENATYKPIKNIGLACDLTNAYEAPLEFLRELIS